MKKYLFIFLVFPLFSFAQDTLVIPKFPIDSTTKEITYTDITEVQNISKTDLYVRLHEWVSVHFNSANNVIQMSDKDAGKIIVKGLVQNTATFKMLFKYAIAYNLHFMMDFTVKDGKYRVILTNFTIEPKEVYSWSSPGSTIEMASVIYKYNKKKRKDDDDDDGILRSKKIALIDQQYLMYLNSFAKETIQSIKSAIQKKKDEF